MKFLHAATLFFTLGLALAREVFTQMGLHTDYSTIGLFGLALTTMLVFRGLLPIVAVGILLALVAFADTRLAVYHLDRQVLQAAALTVVLYPWIKRFLIDA